MLAVLIYMAKKKKMLLLLVVPYSLLILVMTWLYMSRHHMGIVLLYLVFFMWVYEEKAQHEKLKGKTEEFKKRLAKGETLEDILVEAFAVAREAASRVIGEKPYYVQILGGLAIHYGNIAEMKTGEGKT